MTPLGNLDHLKLLALLISLGYHGHDCYIVSIWLNGITANADRDIETGLIVREF
jgi:hypothetical protein